MAVKTIRVSNLREVQAALRKVGGPAAVTAMRTAGREAVATVVPVARANVPKRTGRLSRSIGGGATATGAFVKAGTEQRVPYAGPINYGWSLPKMRKALAKSKSPKWRAVSRRMKKGITATHFLDGAVTTTSPAVVAAYDRQIDKLIREFL